MFANTLTLTIAGVATVLNRNNQDNFGSEYQFTDALSSVSMKIRHSLDNPDKDGISMKRHNLFVERIVFPTLTVPMKKFTSTVTLRQGQYDDPVGASDLLKAVNVLLAASSSQMVLDLSVGIN